MPKFCPECGAKLPSPETKFCSNCGNALQTASISKEEIPSEETFKTSIFELGNKLEEVVQKIFQAKGYETQRRMKLRGKSGTLSEIDVIAKRSGRVIAVECKNYQFAVGIEKIRDFNQKLQDLGFQGTFVASNGFTEGAAEFAESQGIETWDHDELSEKWLALSIGRAESREGQSLTLEYALPLNIDFAHATQIDLQNRDKMKITEVELIYHPYFSIPYSFVGQFKDPAKKLHKFKDQDTLFVDALDGKVLNPMPEKGLGALKKAIQVVTSTTTHAENYRSKRLHSELKNNKPLREYTQHIKDNYKVEKLKPVITPKQALTSSIDFIIEKNTQRIIYIPKTKKGGLPEPRSVTYVPKGRDIKIAQKDILTVPRWSIDFESCGRVYKREVLACSGTVLEDTLSHCPKHFKLGALKIISKKTVAVCEICGQSLCEDHVKSCPTCGKWLCEEHGIECSACQSRFCEQHITLKCPICGSPICSSCVTTCPICKTRYGKNHAIACSRCGTLTCPNCVITTGLIRKTRTCIRCAA